ncbi:MAG: hypothetical protein DSM106950_44895 [Stigonema ocellatum SAG 48.90 = DSM 106950]|nr:hypothetical protein [Stigonema ocellatum SAG 48.90 = DSM 106950]
MKNGQFLPVLFTLLFLFVVVSCRDNDSFQPKSSKPRGSGRLVGSSAYEAWQDNLSWSQQNWISQQADPENTSYTLWNDERSIAGALSSKNISADIDVHNIFNCYQIALVGAYHTQSIGEAKAKEWMIMTYIDGVGYSTETTFNFNVGKQVALSSYTGALDDAVYKSMFIDNTNFKVPGITVIGSYYGVTIYENPLMNLSGSFTFPGLTRANSAIYLQSFFADDMNSQRTKDVIKHEFGHILQREALGITCYFTEIAINSSQSASENGVNGHIHQCFYTETDANRRSKQFHLINEPSYIWNENTYHTSCPNYGAETPCQP